MHCIKNVDDLENRAKPANQTCTKWHAHSAHQIEQQQETGIKQVAGLGAIELALIAITYNDSHVTMHVCTFFSVETVALCYEQ